MASFHVCGLFLERAENESVLSHAAFQNWLSLPKRSSNLSIVEQIRQSRDIRALTARFMSYAPLIAIMVLLLMFSILMVAATAIAGLVFPKKLDETVLSSWPRQKTASLLTVFGEHLGPVASHRTSLSDPLRPEGLSESIDILVLSDTREVADSNVEDTVLAAWIEVGTIIYSRWSECKPKTPASVSDWLCTCGDAFGHALVLGIGSLKYFGVTCQQIWKMATSPSLGLNRKSISVLRAPIQLSKYRQIKERLLNEALGTGFSAEVRTAMEFWGCNPVICVSPRHSTAELLRFLGPALFAPKLSSGAAPRYLDETLNENPGSGVNCFRLQHLCNAPDRMDEVLVTLGVNFLLMLDPAMGCGLSARSVSTGTDSPLPEELLHFPHIRMHRAHRGAVRLGGQIDSSSLPRLIDLTLKPGANTPKKITTSLPPPKEVRDFGIVSLAFMFFKGPILSAAPDQFRHWVRESDILLFANGARIVHSRPTANTRSVKTFSRSDHLPRRVALYQIPIFFEDVLHSKARYHNRAFVFVKSKGDIGAGAAMPVDCLRSGEYMVFFTSLWRPEPPPKSGEEFLSSYRTNWALSQLYRKCLSPILPAKNEQEDVWHRFPQFVFDTAAQIEKSATITFAPDNTEIIDPSAFPLTGVSGTRDTFLIAHGTQDASEYRLSPRGKGQTAHYPIWPHLRASARVSPIRSRTGCLPQIDRATDKAVVRCAPDAFSIHNIHPRHLRRVLRRNLPQQQNRSPDRKLGFGRSPKALVQRPPCLLIANLYPGHATLAKCTLTNRSQPRNALKQEQMRGNQLDGFTSRPQPRNHIAKMSLAGTVKPRHVLRFNFEPPDKTHSQKPFTPGRLAARTIPMCTEHLCGFIDCAWNQQPQTCGAFCVDFLHYKCIRSWFPQLPRQHVGGMDRIYPSAIEPAIMCVPNQTRENTLHCTP